jgi:hypothetical protein
MLINVITTWTVTEYFLSDFLKVWQPFNAEHLLYDTKAVKNGTLVNGYVYLQDISVHFKIKNRHFH